MNKYYKPKGLANFTGNCYMNSLLQCLYYCIEFRDKILGVDFDEENSMVLLLKELFKEFKISQKSVIYPSKIKQKLNENELFKNGEGSDATDLLDFIFNSIYYELKPENSFTETVNYESKIYDKNAMLEEAKEDIMTKTILDEIFLGIYEKDSKCLNGHHKYSFQIEYKIVFFLEKISKLLNKNEFDLYDCFKYNYIYKEKTKDKCYNNYCSKNMDSYEKIFENPKILVIILDRGYNKKYDKKVHFDFEIDISEYMDEKEKNKNSNTYQLIGISIHRGTTGKYGHYVSICLCDDNKYYYFNDSSSSEVNNSYITQILQYSSPYILFYRRVEREKNKPKTKYKNKRIEIEAKGHKETIIEQTSKYLKNYEFNQRSSDEYQWKGEKKRKVISKFFGDGVEFYFEAPILKVKCCNTSIYSNKTFFTIKYSDLKYNSFLDIFNEKFCSFFHEI
jgi:ubiquitin C-terminal hydrolase